MSEQAQIPEPPTIFTPEFVASIGKACRWTLVLDEQRSEGLNLTVDGDGVQSVEMRTPSREVARRLCAAMIAASR